MLYFFRKIRKSLMEQSKIRSYLLYALGEILLVVIGILIALQVSNWNEERNQEKQRQVFLSYLLTNINEDLTHLDEVNTHLEKTLKRSYSLIESYKSGNFDQMEATVNAGWLNVEQTFTVNKTGLDAILGAGRLDLFDPDFSFELQQYYALADQLQKRQELSNTFIREKYEPLYYENYSQSFKLIDVYDIATLFEDDPREATLVDLDLLRQDYEFEAMITIRYVHSHVEKALVDQLREQALKLRDTINLLTGGEE